MGKALMVIAGSISLCLGILGIFIPGLPCTPFLLLSAALYTKSSPRLYTWLINNKYLGRYIISYQRRKGMTKKQKVYAICLMWTMIIISTVFFIQTLSIRVIIIGTGLIGTIVMGIIVPVSKDK